MITATVTIENQWNRGEIMTDTIKFEVISDLINYLDYNRAYIKALDVATEKVSA